MVLDYSNFGTQDEVPKNLASASEVLSAFRDELVSYGLNVDNVTFDGEVHRCSTHRKPNKENGWYRLCEFAPGYWSGVYGDWSDPDTRIEWKSWADSSMDDSERQRIYAAAERYRQEQAEKSERQQMDKAQYFLSQFQQLPPCPHDFPYLTRKKVGVHGDIRFDPDRGCMVIPFVDYHDNWFIGMQRVYTSEIEVNGGKDRTDKTTHGVIDRASRRPFFILQGDETGDPNKVYIGEGYSTCASVREATGCTTVMAAFAGRLKAVGEIVREMWPNVEIIFAADNDCENKENTGVLKANAAAKVIGAEVKIPKLGNKSCDWNDVHCELGIDAMKTLLGVDGRSIYGSCDLLDIFEKEYPHNPVVEGLIDEGESMLLIGEGNVGKSTIILNMAAAIGNPQLKNRVPSWSQDDDNGISFDTDPMLFGHFPIPRYTRTGFLQSENSGKALKGRVSLMIEKNNMMRNALEGRSLKFMMKNDRPCVSGNLEDPEFYKQLVLFVRYHDIGLLVIDPLISFHERDENDNVGIRKMLDDTLSKLQQETGVSTLIIHHSGKDANKGARGASALRDWADGELLVTEVEKREDGYVLKVMFSKSRNFRKEPGTFYLLRGHDMNIMPLFNYSEENKENKSVGRRTGTCDSTDVVDILRAQGGHVKLTKQMVKLVCDFFNCSEKRANDALKKAVDSGLIVRNNLGDMEGAEYFLPNV